MSMRNTPLLPRSWPDAHRPAPARPTPREAGSRRTRASSGSQPAPLTASMKPSLHQPLRRRALRRRPPREVLAVEEHDGVGRHRRQAALPDRGRPRAASAAPRRGRSTCCSSAARLPGAWADSAMPSNPVAADGRQREHAIADFTSPPLGPCPRQLFGRPCRVDSMANRRVRTRLCFARVPLADHVTAQPRPGRPVFQRGGPPRPSGLPRLRGVAPGGPTCSSSTTAATTARPGSWTS